MQASLWLLLLLVQPEPRLQWVKQFPPRQNAWPHTSRMIRDTAYVPVVSEGMVFVGCCQDDTLLALDLETGDERWRFVADGPFRHAPAADGERVYAGSDDGYLYCLDAARGKLLWKYRGGPRERKVLGHGRMISAWPVSAPPLLVDGKVILVAGFWPLEGVFVHALDPQTGRRVWINDTLTFRPSGLFQIVEETLFLRGYGGNGALDLRTGGTLVEKAPKWVPPEPPPVPEGVKGTIAGRFAAGDRIFVSTLEGRLYCFGKGDAKPRIHELPERSPVAESEAAKKILAATGITEGYALVAGLKDGALVAGLLGQSKLRVIAIDSDAEKVGSIRRRLDAAGLFDDGRLAVHVGEAGTFGLPPYFAFLIVSETGAPPDERLLACRHPYGGTLVRPDGALVKHDGPPADAADWTHEFADEGNRLCNRDRLVKAPLGLLWYGGPAASWRFYYDGKVDHQSGDGVNPLPPGAGFVEGRMILQGPSVLAAFDIYTGRLLWESPIPKTYVFGGKGGGVGIHSKRHPEPWKHPQAVAMEVPPTHRPRATGFNYVSVSDAIYVAAGKRCLRYRPSDGKLLSQWKVPLPGDLCWGNLRVSGDLLVATAFHPADLVDAQAGHDGNGGEWAKDRMPMAHLLVLDRHSGEMIWSQKPAWGFLNRGMAVGDGKIYCVDLMCQTVLAKFKEAGRKLPSVPPAILALELRTGKEVWRTVTDVLVKHLTYSEKRDLLVAPAREMIVWKDGDWFQEPKGRSKKKLPGRMRAFRGADGSVAWDVTEAPYYEPHILLGDLLIDRYGWAYDLLTGKPHERTSPLTGQRRPWNFRKGGCNHLVACDGIVTWRGGFFDLAGMSGAVKLSGMDAGCTPTFIPAGGILNAPNYGTHHKRNRSTAMGLIHVPENEFWIRYEIPRVNAPVPLRRAGFNLGAPGDRLAEDGTLWLNVGPKERENVTVEPVEVRWYRQPGLWITSSGVEGALRVTVPTLLFRGKKIPKAPQRRFTVSLHFAEPEELQPGDRVFSVSLQGREVLSGFDVLREAGGAQRPVVRTFEGIEAEGAIEISMKPATDRPALLCGVEIREEK